ncbi:hypothetical protein Krac_4744 [Ktedonobacter racemifer DSM 44963]|uniref:Uncharacterized protein n=1 Tax=Ktedonobacter racemifer DSM 44963 TaxID=485913 RepID=D6TTJ7_KTERA|nr:hypothetical protein Krac_4744 [Ktedonobacter racemifer DSM 44963]
MNFSIRPGSNDDIEDLVQLSLLAWAPVFSSFKQVLGEKIYSPKTPQDAPALSGMGRNAAFLCR